MFETFCISLFAVVVARTFDLTTTWLATPDLHQEGNPVMRQMLWRWIVIANAVICLWVASKVEYTIPCCVCSILVGIRNLGFKRTFATLIWSLSILILSSIPSAILVGEGALISILAVILFKVPPYRTSLFAIKPLV